MSEEIGSVMMDEDEELEAPEIRARPNAAIPITTAVIMLLGALFCTYAGISGIVQDQGMSDEQIVEIQKQMNASGEEVTVEQLETFWDRLEGSSFMMLSPYVSLLTAGLLGYGGVQLWRMERIGVKVGAGGGGLFTLTSLWQVRTMNSAAEGLPSILKVSFIATALIYTFCGLFCLATAFLPLLIASGRAALEPPVALAME